MRSFIMLIFAVATGNVWGQGQVSGYVEDKGSGEKLFGATILIEGTGRGAHTNFYGFFSLNLPDSTAILRVSHVGYKTQTVNLDMAASRKLTVGLQPLDDLDEVVVEENKELSFERQVQLSSINMPARQLKQLPAVGGEIDLIRGIQLMPGVQGGKEGLTGMYVRGGGPDQNLILLDGIPLYNVGHLGGIFSTFNPDVVADVNLMKGGFPARYGGRLSSVLNVKMRDGNRNEMRTEGAVGLVSARISNEGPINKGKGSYIVALRRSYVDMFTRPIARIASGGSHGFGYTFYDFNGKASYDLSPKDKIQVTAYSGHDRGVVNARDTSNIRSSNYFKWGNQLATVRWNRVISDRLFSNTTVGYTNYIFDIATDHSNPEEEHFYHFGYQSGIRDWNLKYDLEYYHSKSHLFRVGAQAIHHKFTPGVNAIRSTDQGVQMDTTFGSQNVNAWELSYYLEDEWTLSDRFSANLGVHFNNYFVEGEQYFSAQPRMTARYQVGPRSSLKAGFAQMQQNVHLLSSTGVGIPTDLWVPATSRTRPQQSWQYTLGYHRMLDKGWEFSVEGYYKNMTNLIAYSDGVNWLEGAADWQDQIEREGEGRARGIEVLLQKKEGRWSGWLGYTLAQSERRFDNIMDGQFFPDRFDRRHDIGLTMAYQVNDKVSFSASWTYGTGEAITLAEGRYQAYTEPPIGLSGGLTGPNRYVEHYEGRNNFRMRSYHRADFGIRFSKDKRWGERTWNLGFYNVYNRANPFYYYWSGGTNFFGVNAGGTMRLRQMALLPILPAFSYEFKLY
ncbi:TonB-dependent receptor [Litoribacter ruber]|uniref:TonB-dependent receptor n=1 Tax=Litoribacter ruber TaxID=702568 RepID=UPI001BD9A837|nr:TonB-dependent receptor [Litoribacter ruber]MBT0810905.1 TonB-dependent receptor [Litoribacter ruber]